MQHEWPEPSRFAEVEIRKEPLPPGEPPVGEPSRWAEPTISKLPLLPSDPYVDEPPSSLAVMTISKLPFSS